MIYNIEILYEVSTVPLVKPGLLAFSYSLLSQYLVSLAPPPPQKSHGLVENYSG